jgi:hypothetical protein
VNRGRPSKGALDFGIGLCGLSSGEILSHEQGEAIISPDALALQEHYEEVHIGVPASTSGLVIGREARSTVARYCAIRRAHDAPS